MREERVVGLRSWVEGGAKDGLAKDGVGRGGAKDENLEMKL